MVSPSSERIEKPAPSERGRDESRGEEPSPPLSPLRGVVPKRPSFLSFGGARRTHSIYVSLGDFISVLVRKIGPLGPWREQIADRLPTLANSRGGAMACTAELPLASRRNRRRCKRLNDEEAQVVGPLRGAANVGVREDDDYRSSSSWSFRSCRAAGWRRPGVGRWPFPSVLQTVAFRRPYSQRETHPDTAAAVLPGLRRCRPSERLHTHRDRQRALSGHHGRWRPVVDVAGLLAMRASFPPGSPAGRSGSRSSQRPTSPTATGRYGATKPSGTGSKTQPIDASTASWLAVDGGGVNGLRVVASAWLRTDAMTSLIAIAVGRGIHRRRRVAFRRARLHR